MSVLAQAAGLLDIEDSVEEDGSGSGGSSVRSYSYSNSDINSGSSGGGFFVHPHGHLLSGYRQNGGVLLDHGSTPPGSASPPPQRHRVGGVHGGGRRRGALWRRRDRQRHGRGERVRLGRQGDRPHGRARRRRRRRRHQRLWRRGWGWRPSLVVVVIVVIVVAAGGVACWARGRTAAAEPAVCSRPVEALLEGQQQRRRRGLCRCRRCRRSARAARAARAAGGCGRRVKVRWRRSCLDLAWSCGSRFRAQRRKVSEVDVGERS